MKKLAVLLHVSAIGLMSINSIFASVCNEIPEGDRIIRLAQAKKDLPRLTKSKDFVCFKVIDPNQNLNQLKPINEKDKTSVVNSLNSVLRKTLFTRASYYRRYCSSSVEFDTIIGENRSLEDLTDYMETRIDEFAKSIEATIDNNSIKTDTETYHIQEKFTLSCDNSCFQQKKDFNNDPRFTLSPVDELEIDIQSTEFHYVCMSNKRKAAVYPNKF